MSARKVVLASCGLVILLLAVYVPAPAVSAPSSTDSQGGRCHQAPTSSIQPLPTYSPKDVWINYTLNGSRGDDDPPGTQLWYQGPASGSWVLYTPPWNPTGQWFGSSAKHHGDDDEGADHAVLNGTIIFDTTFTGGDGFYNFTTVALGRDHLREPGPPGQPATVKAHTTVDSQPPALFIAKPTPGSWTNSEWLQWQAVDRVSGVASVAVSVDGGAAQSFTDASGSMNMSLTTEGVHSVRVTVTDQAGNTAAVPFAFHYDTKVPSLQITSPEPNTYFDASSVNVQWTMSDPAGIANLQLSVDSAPAVILSNTTTSYALGGLAEMGHVVSLLAVDHAGNIAGQTASFTVDMTPPTVQIVTPANGTYSNGHQIQALWMGVDAGSGIDHYNVSLDGAVPITLTDTAGTIFPSVAEGTHTVTVTAYDRAGNAGTTKSVVSVDYTPPTITVTSPTQGSTVFGDVRVNWTATDSGSGLSSVVLVADGVNTPVSPDRRTASLASPGVGPHALVIQAWDKAGNMNQITVAFAYGGVAPPSGPGGASLPATDFWVIMAIIGAIAVGSAYFVVRRRKKAAP